MILTYANHSTPRPSEQADYIQTSLAGEGVSVNIQHLKTFVAIVETGSFSAAAKALSLSQPAVTQHIKGLEQDAGATLLERRYRRIELTEAGRALLPVAKSVLGELDAVRADIASLSAGVSGQLVIAASTTPGVYLIPRLLGDFAAAYREVNVTLCVSDSALVAERVANGEANIGITGAIVRGVAAEFSQLGGDELVAIAPLATTLAGRRLTMADLAEQPFLMRERGSGTRQMAEATMREHGIDPDDLAVVVELDSGEAIVSAVEGGLGVAMVSALVADKAVRLGTVELLDVEGLPAVRPFYAVTPRTALTRAADAFLNLIELRLRVL